VSLATKSLPSAVMTFAAPMLGQPEPHPPKFQPRPPFSRKPLKGTVGQWPLIPYARNARTHSDQQVAQIATSIREFGFTNPVLIDEEDGIIAGDGRVRAAHLLGLDEVPCIVLAHLTPTQRRAYVLAEGRMATQRLGRSAPARAHAVRVTVAEEARTGDPGLGEPRVEGMRSCRSSSTRLPAAR
jgi:hypothetical protein